MKNKIILLYLLLLTFHVAHILEETWGHFWIMDKIFGIDLFLLLNWILFCVPVFFFYLIILDKKTGYYLSIVYSIFMVLNGIVHNLATLIIGKYFDGFAGGFSGIGFIIIGIPLSILLLKNIPGKSIE